MRRTEFVRLNNGWDAEPNVPDPQIAINGAQLALTFLLDSDPDTRGSADYWRLLGGSPTASSRHFLFYFRDNTFERRSILVVQAAQSRRLNWEGTVLLRSGI